MFGTDFCGFKIDKDCEDFKKLQNYQKQILSENFIKILTFDYKDESEPEILAGNTKTKGLLSKSDFFSKMTASLKNQKI